MRKISDLLLIGLIFIFSFFALKSLWGPQFYTSHDGQSHLARLYQLDKVLKDGQFPPRWAGQFAGERGYPVFVFAYPLPYWLAEVFYFLGFNLAESVKLVFALFYLVSGISMYFLVKEIFRNKWAAFVSAILWTWAPYRFVKIFVTASLGESVAFAFVPLVFLSIYKLIKKPSKFSFTAFSLSLASLILTHLITLIIFSPLIICFILWNLSLVEKKKREQGIKNLLFSGFLSFGLSAFYLIPAIWEVRYTRYKEVLVKNYYKQFVDFTKLIYSPWGYGVPKIGPDPLSSQVGIAQWLAVGLSVLFLIFLFFQKKTKKKGELLLSITFLLNFFLSIFLMLEISKPVWDLLPVLQSVDTPWRFLSLSVFTAAFLGSWLVNWLKRKKRNFVIFIFLIILFLAYYGNRNHLRINAPINFPDEYFQRYYWVGSGWDEYRPVWIKDTYHKPPKRKVEIVEGDCQISDLFQKSNLITFKIDCLENSEILVHNAYYPGWKLFVDGVDFTQQVLDGLEKSQGLVMFKVSAGNYQVKLEFGETKLRLIADLSSLSTLSYLLLLFLKKGP